MTVTMREETRGVDQEVGNTGTETGIETMIPIVRQIIGGVEIGDLVVGHGGKENLKRGSCMIETGLIVRMIGTV